MRRVRDAESGVVTAELADAVLPIDKISEEIIRVL